MLFFVSWTHPPVHFCLSASLSSEGTLLFSVLFVSSPTFTTTSHDIDGWVMMEREVPRALQDASVLSAF